MPPSTSPSFRAALATMVVAALLPFAGQVQQAPPAAADAADNFGLVKEDSVEGEALIGEHVTYTLTAVGSQSSDDYLYNLSFSDTLPEHVAFLSADPAPTAVLDDVPSPGQTTLIWENVADLPDGSRARVSYTVDTNPDHVPGTFIGHDTLPVGSLLHNEARAAASEDPFTIPDWSDTTGLFTGDFDGEASTTHDTLMIPFRVTKTGPEELLRGVHTNGFDGTGSEGEIFDIEIENNPDYPLGTVSLVDTLDPKLEFQGCDSYYDPLTDNSLVVVEEWVGSGPVATAALSCDTPSTIDTSPLGETIVTWPVPDLGPGDVHLVQYQAGFPLWANAPWPDPTDPYLDPTGLRQGRNLDNNLPPASTGEGDSVANEPELLTPGEQEASNLAEVTGTYAPTSTPYTYDDTHLTEAEDIVIEKSMAGSLVQQSGVTTTLTIRTGEYRSFTELRVRDLLPSPLCFLGTYNSDLSPSTDWRDTDCAGQGSPMSTIAGAPVNASSVQELAAGGPYGTGRFEIVWDHGDNDALDTLGSDQSVVITYESIVRSTYRGGFLALPGEPVLAGDYVTNSAEVSGPDFRADTDLLPVDPADADGGIDGDTTGAELGNTLPTIDKRVSAKEGPLDDGAGATAATCATDHGTITWVQADPDPVLGFGPGDVVCFELNASYPSNLDYEGTIIQDILPPSYVYIPGSAARVTPDDTIDGTVASGTGPVTFTLGGDGNVDDSGNTFKWVIAAQMVDPMPDVALDIDANLQKMIHNNNSGLVFQYRDQTNAERTEPQVRMAKGVEFVDSVDDGIDAGPHGPDWDGSLSGAPTAAEVQADARVGYRVDVWNTGNKDALDTEVWDVLPAAFTCADVDAASIDNGGSCVVDPAGDYIAWSGITVPLSVDSAIPDLVPDDETTAPVTLRYELNVPGTVDPSQVYENHAGVRSYQADINGDFLGSGSQRFVYYPDDNIDTTATPNTDPADDVATLFTAAPELVITQLSAVDEDGNAAPGTDTGEELTIGEIVEYTVTLSIPEGTTVYDSVITVPLPPGVVFFDDTGAFGGAVGSLDPSVSSTDVDLFGTPLLSGTPTWPADGGTGDILYTLPALYRNEVGDGPDTVTLTFYAQVVDDPANQADPAPATSFDETATYDWNDVTPAARPTLTSNTVTSEVVEPNPQIVKSHTDPTGDDVVPGQVITYEVTISNPSAGVNNVSTAHDPVVVDTVPVGATPLDPAGMPVTGPTDTVATIGAADGDWDEATRTITWSLPDAVVPDGLLAYTYEVQVDNPALASGTLDNTADLTARSLDGDLDPNVADARSYTDSDVDSLKLPSATAAKDVEPLGDPGDDRVNFAVGEEVDFDLTVTLPSGSIGFDLTMFDQLPAGFVFDSFGTPVVAGPCEVYDAGAGASTGTVILPSEIELLTNVGGDPQRIAFFLGDLVSPGGDCTITLPYTVIVASTAASGDDITNAATLAWNDSDQVGPTPASLPAGYDDPTSPSWSQSDGPIAETITVVEPQLEIDLDVTAAGGIGLIDPACDTTSGNNNTAPDGDDPDGLPADGCDTEPGTTFENTLTVTNTGTADAHDTRVVVDVPVGLVVTNTGGGTWDPVTRTITWDFVPPITAAGGTLALVYETALDPSDSLTDGQNLTTDADIPTYFGLPAADRTNAEVPTYGNDAIPARGTLLPDQTTVQVHMPELGVTKAPATGQDPTDVRFDEPFTWEIVIENTASVASAFDVDAVDVLPDGWTYVPLSAMVTTPYGGPTQAEPGCTAVGGCNQPGSTNAETLTWTDLVSGPTEPLAPGGQIVITLDAIPQSAAMAPDQVTGESFTGAFAHTNSVTVSGEDGSGSDSCCGGAPYTDTATDDVLIRRADIEVAKSIHPDPGPYFFGSFVDYVVTVSNVGPDDATGVALDDLLAGTGLIFDSATPDQGTYDDVTGEWAVGDIAVGQTFDLAIRARLGQVNDPIDPSDRTVNFAEASASDQYDSDSTPANGDPALAAEDDETRVSILVEPSSMGDYVWLDLNQDGVQDPGEPGIPGVEVAITWIDPFDGSTQNRTATTNAVGAYGFPPSDGLPADIPITVTFDASQAALTGLDPTWDYGTFLGGGGTDTSDPAQIPLGINGGTIPASFDVTIDSATIDPGLGIPADLQVDFGFVGTFSLGDEVWWDVDAGGTAAPNGDDFMLPGVTVNGTWAGWDGILDDDPATIGIDESADNLVFTDVTDAAGTYLLPDLPPGSFRVEVDPATLPPGLTTPTFDFDTVATPNASETTVDAANPDPRDQDFSYTGAGRIGDTVWFDHDADGIQDAGEPGLAGVTVTIDWTHPSDPTITHSFDVVTDADGNYDVTGLPYGDYVVTVDPATLPGNMAATHDADDTADGGVVTGTSDSSAVTLDMTSPTALDQDFGYRGLGSIGDTVFYDIDATELDGILDAADVPLENVAVTVTWGGVDGVVGDDPATLGVDESADDFSTTVATLANGTYLVDHLPHGAYEITVDPATLPPGMVPTYDADGTATVDISTTTLTTGNDDDLTQDFSYTGQGTIGDTVWYDYDADGAIDTVAGGDAFDEVGIGSITVDLTWAGADGALGTGDDVPFTTETAPDGTYLFENLPFSPAAVDTYVVTVDTTDPAFPAGLTPTFDADGTGTADTSTLELPAAPGEDLDQDFGYTGVASVGDTVWLDLDNSGTPEQDPADPAAGLPAEPGIPDVELTITWINPNGPDFAITTVTDADGNYTVPNLPYGDVTVAVTGGVPADLTQTYGPDGVTPTSALALAVDDPLTPTMDEANPDNQDFSYTGPGRVGDTVWFDQDNDGAPDPAGSGVFDGQDQPLENIGLTVTWAGWDGTLGDDPTTPLIDESADDLAFTPTTDVNGEYLVENLPVGDYEITVDTATLPLGIDEPTFDFDGTGTPHTSATTLSLLEPEDLDQDFSYTATGAVGDTVWFDLNGDGLLDPDEVALGGVTVELTYAGPTGPVTVTTTTDADGYYEFVDLPFDTPLTVTVDPATLPTGFAPTHDRDDAADGSVALGTADSAIVTLTAAEPTADDVDFGYRGAGSIGDTIWLDRDGAGGALPDPADVLLPDVEVTLVWANPTAGPDLVVTTTTDATGSYDFAGLPDGDYTVTVDPATLPTGTDPVHDPDLGADNTAALSLLDDPGTPAVESTDTDQDFSYTGTGSVGDTIWHDRNADGSIDPGEEGIAGVVVTLVWTDPITGATYTETATTDADGLYDFANVPAGDVVVTVDPTTLPAGYGSTADRDGTPDDTTALTTGPGDALDDVDFGYVLAADLSITKTHVGDFVIGADNTWTITVTNAGPGLAEAPVVVTDVLPVGATFVTTVGTDWTCMVVGQAVTCTYQPGGGPVPLPIGSSSFDVVVNIDGLAAPTVTNTATVDSPTPEDDPADNSASDDTAVPLALLAIDKTLQGDTLRNGTTATYLLTVTNLGPSSTSGAVTVTDDLPASLSYVSAAGAGWNCDATGQLVTCAHDAALAVGAAATIELDVRVDAGPGAIVENVAAVDGGNTVNGAPVDPDFLAGIGDELVADPDGPLARSLGLDGSPALASTLAQSTSQAPPVLAFTGASTNWLFGLGAVALITGFGLVLAAHAVRRRDPLRF